MTSDNLPRLENAVNVALRNLIAVASDPPYTGQMHDLRLAAFLLKEAWDAYRKSRTILPPSL
jgi:hypothetical protein